MMLDQPRTSNQPPGFIEALRWPSARNYLFIGFAALVVYYMLMPEALGRNAPKGFGRASDLGTLLALAFAIAGLTARWVISPIMFLILSTYLFCDPNLHLILPDYDAGRSPRRGGRGEELGLADLLLAASILVYLMAQFRLLSLVHKSMPDDPPPRRKGQPEPGTPRRPADLFADREIGQIFGLAPICVFVGFSIWLMVSGYESIERLGGTWGIEPPFARLMLFAWAFISGALIASVVFRYIAMRNMSRREARLMLQDMFWQETRREQERVYRWRRWYKEKRMDRGSEGS